MHAPQRFASIAVAVLVTLSAARLAAQAAPSDADRAAVATLSSDLRNLITAQEGWYALNGTYALSVAELGGAYRTSTGVTIALANASKNSYGAVARLAGKSGSCVIFIGLGTEGAPLTDIEKKRAPEGEPSCDGDGLTERAVFARDAQAQAGAVLIRVAKLQERYFGRTGAYATDVAALGRLDLPATLTVTIELAPTANQETSFLATATDSRYVGFSCVLRNGYGRFGAKATTAAERTRPRGDFMPICDTFK